MEEKTTKKNNKKKTNQNKSNQNKSNQNKSNQKKSSQKKTDKNTETKNATRQTNQSKKVEEKKEVIKKEENNKQAMSKKEVKVEVKEKKNEKVKENTKVESKNLKKKEKENASKKVVTTNEMGNLIKIVLAIVAIFLVFYGLTIVVTKNKKDETPDSSDALIQYDEILLGTLLEQPKSEYYVLVTKSDDEYRGAYTAYLSSYKSKDTALRYYTANLDNSFNKSYEAEESKINVSNIKDLKLKGSTLLKVKDKKIVASYEGNEKIIEHLKSLI